MILIIIQDLTIKLFILVVKVLQHGMGQIFQCNQ